jgi:lipopolysaccharide assembly protein A
MQFLKILFWCLLAFVAAVFTFGNWKWVPIQLFGNLVADVNLPLLLLAMFLLGFLPTLIYQRAARWRLRQRLAQAEQSLATLRANASPSEPIFAPEPKLPPAAVPSAVPPGVS